MAVKNRGVFFKGPSFQRTLAAYFLEDELNIRSQCNSNTQTSASDETLISMLKHLSSICSSFLFNCVSLKHAMIDIAICSADMF